MRSSLLLLSVLVVGAAPAAQAQSPIQLALFTPIQLVPKTKAVKGLRLEIYGTNTAVTGLDFGVVNVTTGGPSAGIQWGFVNMVTGPFTGWQSSAVNVQRGAFKGLQMGLVSMAGAAQGVQWGGFNSAQQMHGLQLGVVNYAVRTNGVQIGLINIIKEGGQFPIFPIVNWGK